MKEKADLLFPSIFGLFMRNGIKSMTMDDICKELGISKKTLYKHVRDKSDLVNRVMLWFVENEEKLIEELATQQLNAIEELFAIFKNVTNKIKEIHPSSYYDLQKYYPEAWNTFLKYKNVFVYNSTIDNMVKGIREGLYRENVDIEIVTKIYISRIDLCIDSKVFPPDKFKFKEVVLEMMRYHIRGIATKKGWRYLSEKINDFTI